MEIGEKDISGLSCLLFSALIGRGVMVILLIPWQRWMG
jgi:hypothetical protein